MHALFFRYNSDIINRPNTSNELNFMLLVSM